jgi:acyl-CoA dehydrogenase
MIIPKTYGGLGFSAYAHSAVVHEAVRRAARPPPVSVMVPNSLGPAELLLHYGTEEQKDYYLPRLAKRPGDPVLRPDQPAGRLGCRLDSRTSAWSARASGRASESHRHARHLGTSATSRSGRCATLLGLAFRLHDPDAPAWRRGGPRHHLRAGADQPSRA